MITCEIIRIKKTNNSEEIEREIKSHNITPLRWAIVKIEGTEMLLSVSYEK